jgi:hypothetical protein
MIYSFEVQLTHEYPDHSEATRAATELTAILQEAGYDHVATTVMDEGGETVSEFML